MSPTTQANAVRNTALVAWSEKSDEELLLAYRGKGEDGAFEELVHRYERELYSYLRRYLGDAAMAEDAFQTTFLQVHLKCDTYKAGRPVRPWLYTIATHQAIDAQRRTRRQREVTSLDRRRASAAEDDVGTLMDLLASKDPGPAEQVATAEHRQQILATVAQLPELLRTPLLLVYYQGMKYREAAEVLKIPVGTVKSRLHSALLKFHELWGGADKSGAK